MEREVMELPSQYRTRLCSRSTEGPGGTRVSQAKEVGCITYVHFPSETKSRNDATVANARVRKCWFEGSLVKYKEMVHLRWGRGVGQLPP